MVLGISDLSRDKHVTDLLALSITRAPSNTYSHYYQGTKIRNRIVYSIE